MYGILHGHLLGRIVVLFKVRIPNNESQRLALVRMMKVDFGGRPDDILGIVTVSNRTGEHGRDLWIVNICSLVAAAHLIQDTFKPTCWFVNNRIDLWTFNKFY